MTKQEDLIAYLFEGRDHRLSGELMQWMDASSRFTAFVETYRDKIRKKIRVNREAESILDLRSELEVAYSLLNDRRLGVAYEPYASEKRRGPDFSVTYRANLIFNVEVARIRAESSDGDAIRPEPAPERIPIDGRKHQEERILRILLNKLGQMQPGMANLLVIQTRAAFVLSIDLDQLMQGVKVRAEGKDPTFYAASRYMSPAAFYKDFLRLSGILLYASPRAVASPDATAPAHAKAGAITTQLWINKQARPGLDEKVSRLVLLTLQTSQPPDAG